MNELSHLDEQGRAKMVDVGPKAPVRRIAIAAGQIVLNEECRRLVEQNLLKKGDALSVAQVAGIQAAKRCADLIPLCHPLLLDHIAVDLGLTDTGVEARASVRCTGRTGVEMEALTAVSVALLTVYDMCKAVDKQMHIEGIHLLSKEKQNV